MNTDTRATSGDRALFMTQFRNLGYSIPSAWALADDFCDSWNQSVHDETDETDETDAQKQSDPE